MPVYTLERTQWLPASPRSLWEFISNPSNLKIITPDSMDFDIRTKPTDESMFEGMMISYIVRPLLGLPVRWVTEITHITEGEYFVDEQRIGPYTLWHHEHHIRPDRNGTFMLDRITYAPPFGWLGAFAHPILIRPKLDAIFNYRRRALEGLFGRDDADHTRPVDQIP